MQPGGEARAAPSTSPARPSTATGPSGGTSASTPIAARRWSASPPRRPRRWSGARSWSSCGRWSSVSPSGPSVADAMPIEVNTPAELARRPRRTRSRLRMSDRPKIAFQGEPGANSDEACRDHYPDYEPCACATFEDAFEAMQVRRRALGMIPVENSIAGRQGRRAPPPAILGPPHHRRAVQADPLPADGQPGRRAWQDVKTVISCRSPLGQCRKTLRKPRRARPSRPATRPARPRRWPSIPIPPARRSRRRSRPRSTASTSSLRDIEDERHNTTRFLVMTADETRRGRRRAGLRHQLRLPRPQHAGRALQGAGRLRDQRRQHDQAGELHGERRLHRHLLLRRGRRPARGCSPGPRLRGAGLLLRALRDPGRLRRPTPIARRRAPAVWLFAAHAEDGVAPLRAQHCHHGDGDGGEPIATSAMASP